MAHKGKTIQCYQTLRHMSRISILHLKSHYRPLLVAPCIQKFLLSFTTGLINDFTLSYLQRLNDLPHYNYQHGKEADYTSSSFPDKNSAGYNFLGIFPMLSWKSGS